MFQWREAVPSPRMSLNMPTGAFRIPCECGNYAVAKQRLSLTRRTPPEDFEPVVRNLELCSTTQFVKQGSHRAIFELHDRPAIGTDEVVMVTAARFGEDV